MTDTASPLVRPAGVSDLDELARLGMVIQGLHASARPDIFREPEESALRAFFHDRLADGSHVLVAEASGVVAGYLLAEHLARPETPFKLASSILYIHHVAVDPAARSRGIGTALIEATARLASDLRASTLRLDSWCFNTGAHVFFERVDFVPLNIVFERGVW